MTLSVRRSGLETVGVNPEAFDRYLESCRDPRLPRRVLNLLDGQRTRRASQHARLHSDDFARPSGSDAGREPIGSPQVARTVVLPRCEAEEPCPTVRAKLHPPRFVIRILDNDDFQSRHCVGPETTQVVIFSSSFNVKRNIPDGISIFRGPLFRAADRRSSGSDPISIPPKGSAVEGALSGGTRPPRPG